VLGAGSLGGWSPDGGVVDGAGAGSVGVGSDDGGVVDGSGGGADVSGAGVVVVEPSAGCSTFTVVAVSCRVNTPPAYNPITSTTNAPITSAMTVMPPLPLPSAMLVFSEVARS
jgi:hypothetical protein